MQAETLRTIVVILHALSAAVGVGGVIVTDYIFAKFLRDRRISARESNILKSFSEIIWIALGALILTGIFLVSTNTDLLYSPKFQLKMVIVVCTIANGLLLNFFITPKLSSIAFHEGHTKPADAPDKVRKIALAGGAISIVSWLLAFILGSLKSIPFTFVEGMTYYFLLLCGITLIASFTKKQKNQQ